MAKLSNNARKIIGVAIDQLFDRAKGRLLGPDPHKRYALGGKRLAFSYVPNLTLGGLFDAVSREHSVRGETDTLSGVLRIAESYLDAIKERTKARALKEIEAHLNDSPGTVKTVLGGKLSELWGDIHADVKRIVETETQTVRNLGTYEAIGKIAALSNIKDPYVYFVVVRDGARCAECTRLHLLADGRTPRVWRQSDLGSDYHKKGEPNPKWAGLHPNCRCQLTMLQPGYGFNGSGMVTYKGPKHDEYEHQQELSKAEAEYGEPLEKVSKKDFAEKAVKWGWSPLLPLGHPEGLASHRSTAWRGNPAISTISPPTPRQSLDKDHSSNDLSPRDAKQKAAEMGLVWDQQANDFTGVHTAKPEFVKVYQQHGFVPSTEIKNPPHFPWLHRAPVFDVGQIDTSMTDPNEPVDSGWVGGLMDQHAKDLKAPTNPPGALADWLPTGVQDPSTGKVLLDRGGPIVEHFKRIGGRQIPIKLV